MNELGSLPGVVVPAQPSGILTTVSRLTPITLMNVENARSSSPEPGTNEFIYDAERTKGRLVIIDNVFR
jgi:hypothetical protein